MFGRTRFYEVKTDEKNRDPEQGVLERLAEWRKENPTAVILGMQWITTPRMAECAVTFETPESKAGSNGEK